MNNIIIDLQNNGYNIEKNNDIIRVKVDSDMFFEININSFEIIKRERNYGQTFGVYQSLDECLIMLYFTLLSSKINNDSLDFEKKIENTNDLQTIYSLFVEKYGKDYVDKNIFFNKKIEDVNGFCLTSHFEEYNGLTYNDIYYKKGDNYFLVASGLQNENGRIFKALNRKIEHKLLFDQKLNDMNIVLDDFQYLEAYSSYSNGYVMKINSIEKKNEKQL